MFINYKEVVIKKIDRDVFDMNKEIIDDIKVNLKTRIMNHYKLELLNEVGGYQNFIYEFNQNENFYILRVTHAKHRSYTEIEAELAFLDALSKSNVPIAKVVKFENNHLIEKLNTIDNEYFVTVFEKAIGLTWREYEQTNKTQHQAGKALGKIHQVSKELTYHTKRKSWLNNEYLKVSHEVIPHQNILEKLEFFLKELEELIKTDDTYGLVHGDYNFGNIIFGKDHLTIIDFDESEYNWFVYDIAVYLFYYLLGGNPAQMDKQPNISLFKSFITGYLEETNLNIYWIAKLPLFFRLREFILLSSLYRSKNMNPWIEAYIDTALYRIENDIPFIDINYVELFKECLNNK